MADVLVLRGAEALRKVSFHNNNNDYRRFRPRTLSEMAEPDPIYVAGTSATAPINIPNTNRSEGTLTDSEVALTPDVGSSGSGSSQGAEGGVGRLTSAALGGGSGGIGGGAGGGGGIGNGSSNAARAVSVSESAVGSTVGSPQLLPEHAIADTPTLGPTLTPLDKSPLLGATASSSTSRHASFSGSSSYQEDWDLPPLDRLTVLDLLDNFALPQHLDRHLEKLSKGLSKGISAQTRKLRKSRDAIKSRSQVARERMVEEWRHRVPSAEEQLDRYRKRMRNNVEKLGRQWNEAKVVTMRDKVSFICGVLNIFISGYIIGGCPEYMHLWYTAQILYFMPIRFYTYHRRGYHYFLADLCYFVNFLLLLSIWAFPASKRLLVAVFCLAFGNNAVAIIMWRNSLVFHSFDKVTSLFIHVMPCATLHCMVHLLSPELKRERFPAVYALQNAPPGTSTYANMFSMLAWSTVPYAVWQLSYYFFITVRRREKIAAGRPTSFTWLRRSYSKTWIGRLVLALPLQLQESAFMMIQYLYAVFTMLPCPLWFYSRIMSSVFLMGVFTWSIYNGATYYIDVFGRRFQKELEAMKLEVANMSVSPGGGGSVGGTAGGTTTEGSTGAITPSVGPVHSNFTSPPLEPEKDGIPRTDSIDAIPLLERESLASGVTTESSEFDSTGDGESTDDGRPDGAFGSSKKTQPTARSPGAASAAEAIAAATMTGAEWDLGAKDVARRRH